MKRLRMFKITRLPVTNTRPSRISIIDVYSGARLIINYTAEGSNNMVERAAEYLKERGFNLVADSFDADNNHYILSDTWGEIRLKE